MKELTFTTDEYIAWVVARSGVWMPTIKNTSTIFWTTIGIHLSDSKKQAIFKVCNMSDGRKTFPKDLWVL